MGFRNFHEVGTIEDIIRVVIIKRYNFQTLQNTYFTVIRIHSWWTATQEMLIRTYRNREKHYLQVSQQTLETPEKNVFFTIFVEFVVYSDP